MLLGRLPTGLLAPQLVIPCLLIAMQDAGDMACEESLAPLADAGVCGLVPAASHP